MESTKQDIAVREEGPGRDAPVYSVRGRPVRPWLVLFSLIFGFFMALLDATIVNIAIPTIEQSLHTDLEAVGWVLSAYNLVFAVLLVSMGRFADLYGRKRIFMIGMALFSLGSLFCALAETFGSLTATPAINWLIGFRALQAIGAAALTPVSLAIIMAIFPPKQRGVAIGVWGALAGLAAAIGPILGGFLVQNFDWRWIFFVNLPFCIIGLLMVALFVPETRDTRVTRGIDVPGTVLLTAAIFCFVLAILQGNDWGWLSTPVLGLFVGALVLLALFVVAELRNRNPIVDFALFKLASFTGASVTMFLFCIALQGAFLIVVLYLTSARNYDPLGAAYALLPMPLASFIVSALMGRFGRKVNTHWLGMVGALFLTIGFLLLGFMRVDAPYLDLAWRCVFVGIGMGMLFQSQPTISLSEVPRAKLGVGSGIFNTSRQLGFALGVAVLISIFTGSMSTHVDQARQHAVQIVLADEELPLEMRKNIVTQLVTSETSSEVSEAGRGNTSNQEIDLTQLVEHLPLEVPAAEREAIRRELQIVGERIGQEFNTEVQMAFRTPWFVSSAFALAALISALLAYLGSRRSVPTTGEGAEMVNVGH